MKQSTRRARLALSISVPAVAILAACEPARAVLPGIEDAMNRIAGMRLFVNAESPARRQADAWRATRPADAELMDRIAREPVAQWIGNWNRDVRGDVGRIMSTAAGQAMTPVLVAYNIPNRDCGSYSAGGSANAGAYRDWIRAFAAGLGGRAAVVVLEPDAIAGADCLSATARAERFDLLRDAVKTLKAANALVYIDAGHAGWLSAADAAARLTDAGIAMADGFSLNVSNYISTDANAAFGDAVSRRVGGKHYVIDTSRNGVGGRNGEWCNVSGQSLGNAPTTHTGRPLADAYLWIKQPGESDGTCNGGPRAGQWWPEYALSLAQRAGQMLASR